MVDDDELYENFNAVAYAKYRDLYLIACYISIGLGAVLCIAAAKYRQLARIFYHQEMFNILLVFMLPITEETFQTVIILSYMFVMNICFYVDIKSNLLSLFLTQCIQSFVINS